MKNMYERLTRKKKVLLHITLILLFFSIPIIFDDVTFLAAAIWITVFIIEIILILFTIFDFLKSLIKKICKNKAVNNSDKNVNTSNNENIVSDVKKQKYFEIKEFEDNNVTLINKEKTKEIIDISSEFYPKNETFIFVDVETASLSNNTICSIGMIIVKNGATYNYSSFINPGEKITNTQFHGIKDEDVKNAPRFDLYWKSVEKYFQDKYIFIAHNAIFDISVIKKDLQRYNLSFEPRRIIDTMWVAKESYYNFDTQKGDLKLDTLCNIFNIELNHHNANSDITATKKLLEVLLQMSSKSYKDFINVFYTNEKNRIEKNINDISINKYWRDIENGKRPMYFTNWDKLPIMETPNYDNVNIEDLLITSTMKNRATCNIERIYKQYALIEKNISNIGGKILSKGTKSAKSYIEFYFMDYAEYKKLKFLGYKIFHANDVEDFFNDEKETIEKFITKKNQEKSEKELIKLEQEKLKHEKFLKKQEKLIEKENKHQKELEQKKLIVQLDGQGNIIRKYETLTAAAVSVGINPKSIRECCKGVQKHAAGYMWKYEKLNSDDEQEKLKAAYDKAEELKDGE